MTAYRDDIEALEAEAEELRHKLAATEEKIAHAERVREAKLRAAPKGPPLWLGFVIVGVIVPIAIVLLLLARFSLMRG
jgi:hypothetical protein